MNKMKYENEKLNITIENREYVDIIEFDNYVELRNNGVLKFILFNNSSAVLFDNSSAKLYDNSSAELYDNSSAELCDFTVVWVKSNNIKIETFNHFGSIIKQVFKVKEKMLVYKKLANKLIATLELEKGQIFQSQYHSKCRTDRAKVIVIENIDKTEKFDIGYSQNDNKFVYKVGETVSADYDEEIKECSSGIHFFLSRKSAEEY